MDSEDRDDLYGLEADRAADVFSMDLSDRWDGMISVHIDGDEDGGSVSVSLTPYGVECLAKAIRKACDAAVDAALKAKGLQP